ncbi:30S ribosomal protein S15 [Linum perenne]
MALALSRANRRPLNSPYRIHQFISQSSPLSTVPPGNDNTSSSSTAADAADSQPDRNPVASYLSDVKDSLRKDQQRSPIRPNPVARNPSGGAPLGEVMKVLSEYRKKTSTAPSGNNKPAAQRQGVSVVDIFKRNVPDGSSQIGFDSIRNSLKSFKSSNTNNAKGGLTSPWNFRGSNVAGNSVRSTVISGAGGGGNLLFEKIEGGVEKDFERRYSYEELGNLLKELRPEKKQQTGGQKGLFSLQELSERMNKLKDSEAVKISKSPFSELRQSIQKLADLPSQKQQQRGPTYKSLMLSTSTPDYTLHPPKEELVEKYFHPDNMSSQEKMKIELAKVRDEFKMSESDCGSARVQVAQLTTKIKHLSSVLHKKDKHSRKGLQEMVQKRKKLLRYLRRTDWDSFCFVLTKLGLRDNPDYKNLA